MRFLPHPARRHWRIALGGRLNSSLARGCEVVLDWLASIREVLPLNLGPHRQHGRGHGDW